MPSIRHLSIALAVATAAATSLCTPAAAADTIVRLVDVDGRKLHVEIEGSGPPLLFLHGGLQFFANEFAGQRAEFARSHTVIGIDRTGHGHSADDARPFTYQGMTDDTAAVLHELGVGPVDVIGSSDGGDIGLLLAHDHPERVRRLVVTGANLRGSLPPDEAARRATWSDAQIAERTAVIERQLPPRFRTDYEAVTPDGPDHWHTLLIKSYRMWLTPVVLDAAALKAIAAPVLVIAGDHDFASIEDTAEIFRGLPNAQLLIVPGAGHGTFVDRPDLMHAAIHAFLDAPAR